MRSYTGVLVLFLLSACGGGDNVTNPPAGQSFTLTISSTGTGSGRVVTAPGTSPGIDCTLSPTGQATGTCSASYPEGTSVSVTLTPDGSSTFGGWSGDASDCGAALTCSIAVDRNKSAVAQLSAMATPTGNLVVTSYAFYPDPTFAGEGAVIWVAEARNTSSQWVETAELDFTSHDSAGNVLASDFTFVGPIPPGETRASQGLADLLGTEASATVNVGPVTTGDAHPQFAQVQIVSSNWRVDSTIASLKSVSWTVEVQNNTGAELQSAGVDFVTYDAEGKVLAADFTFVGPIPPGEKRASQGNADYHGGETSVAFQIRDVSSDET
jgi:List-Bact-rpt repeat protein